MQVANPIYYQSPIAYNVIKWWSKLTEEGRGRGSALPRWKQISDTERLTVSGAMINNRKRFTSSATTHHSVSAVCVVDYETGRRGNFSAGLSLPLLIVRQGCFGNLSNDSKSQDESSEEELRKIKKENVVNNNNDQSLLQFPRAEFVKLQIDRVSLTSKWVFYWGRVQWRMSWRGESGRNL